MKMKLTSIKYNPNMIKEIRHFSDGKGNGQSYIYYQDGEREEIESRTAHKIELHWAKSVPAVGWYVLLPSYILPEAPHDKGAYWRKVPIVAWSLHDEMAEPIFPFIDDRLSYSNCPFLMPDGSIFWYCQNEIFEDIEQFEKATIGKIEADGPDGPRRHFYYISDSYDKGPEVIDVRQNPKADPYYDGEG
jgi:hypothetical protein